MRWLALVFLIFLCAFSGYGQDTLNQTDAHGRKQGHWIYYGKDFPALGFPEEGKVEEGTYLDNRKEGVWTKYYTDGITPKTIGTYKNNRPQGKCRKLATDGTVIWEGNLTNADFSGLARTGIREESHCDWRKKGVTFENGQVYDSSGQPIIPVVPNDHVPDASIQPIYCMDSVNPEILREIYLEQEDTLQHVIATSNGKSQSDGHHKLYNENDELFVEGEFRRYQLWQGKVYEYDADGILLKVKIYRQGRYFADGQL